MDDLAQFLRARLDENAAVAEAARGRGDGRWHHDTSYPNGYVYDAGSQPVVYDESTPSHEEADHIARHDPARVLRDVEARRGTLEFLVAELERTDSPWWYDDKLERLLKLSALPYADHPDYRTEWAP
jgi:hypothetical protein